MAEVSTFSLGIANSIKSRANLSVFRETHASQIRKEMKKLKKAKKKQDMRDLKMMQQRRDEIKATQDRIRQRND